MNILNFVDTINEWIEPFKRFVSNNHDNPMMWLGFILIGIAVFSIAFGALHRSGD